MQFASWALSLRPPFRVLTPLRFSTDEGQCWHTYNFTSDPLHFSGMDSEPGSRSMNVSLWGYRNDFSKWVVITIDFRKLFTRDCECVGGRWTTFGWCYGQCLMFSLRECLSVQVLRGTMCSGWLTQQNPVDLTTAVCWAIKKPSCA